ncbi:MAG: hypothetical protein IKQ10_01250 [Oscillospiraceae bacterium]|nr:hypothetical protein [Oscillospiraceae bacterium]
MTASEARRRRLERKHEYYELHKFRWREYSRRHREKKAAERGLTLGERRGRPAMDPEDITVCLHCTRPFCDGSFRCYRLERQRRDARLAGEAMS